MYSFLNDYSELAHPNILNAMVAANLVPEEGYYNDSHSARAKELIRGELGGNREVAIHFMPGGTLTNLIAISAFLRPHQAVVAAADAHIFTHETGAIEAVGHKILAIATEDGKITPEQIQPVLDEHNMEHMVEPAMVAISNATEMGTIYTRAELEALHRFCQKNGLLLYCDGARLGSALMSRQNDLCMADMVACTDAFYIGGTKNGALAGEALVIVNPALGKGFRHIAKQKGGLMAKGAVVGIQFEELFRDRLFFELAGHENRMAELIYAACQKRGYPFLCACQSNQLFPVLPVEKIQELEKSFKFLRWKKIDDGHWAVRLVTSWATQEKTVAALIDAL